MNTKTIVISGLKVIVLAFILTVCFMVAANISGISTLSAGSEPPPVNAEAVLIALLVASLLEASILSYLILRSRWSGWKLVGTVFLAFYGLNTIVAQIESVVYLQHQLPEGMISKLFVMGAIVAGLFSPLAVLILSKRRQSVMPQENNLRLVIPKGEWVWKIGLIAIAYLILYYTFGYFIAWKNPAVQAYYRGTDPGSFLAQLGQIWAATPWMFPFQAFRGMLLMTFALPVIRMHKGQSGEIALAVALLFAVWSSQLLLPNPYMPEEVAKTHLVETASANFVFGWLVGWLLSRHHVSLRDLFGQTNKVSNGAALPGSPAQMTAGKQAE
jgi:hypothetical protein